MRTYWRSSHGSRGCEPTVQSFRFPFSISPPRLPCRPFEKKFNQRVLVGAPATQSLSNPRPKRPSARALWSCEPAPASSLLGARTLMQARCRPGSGVRSGWRDWSPSCRRPVSTPPWRRRRWTSCGRRGRLSSSCAPLHPHGTSTPWASCSGPGLRATVPPAAGARACCTRPHLPVAHAGWVEVAGSGRLLSAAYYQALIISGLLFSRDPSR